MTTRSHPSFSGLELLEPRTETRVGFDTSSLNRFGEDLDSLSVCASLAEAQVAPVLSSLSIIEILKWGDDRSRDRLLDSVTKLRRVADYRLLPLPHEVVEAWFLAWLAGPTDLVLGAERTAKGVQDVLERAAARDPAWRQVATRFASEEQRLFRERLKRLRFATGQFEGPKPGSAAEFIEGILGARDAMATVINAWFPPSLHGQAPLTPDEAAECIKRVPALRADLVSLGLAAYRHAVQGQSTRKGAAGAIDISQAAYFPLTDIFVVDDGGMLAHVRDVVEIAALPTRVVPYAELLPTLQASRAARKGARRTS